MDWADLELEYYKLFPDKIALDVNNLTPLQKGAWAGIWLEMHRIYPPGLIFMDLPKLQGWSGLKAADWERHCVPILAKFKFHPATATLHDVRIQRSFIDVGSLLMRKRMGGKKSAARRNDRKIGPSSSSQELPKHPYFSFQPPFIEINAQTWDEISKIAQKLMQNPTLLQESSKTVGRVLNSTQSVVLSTHHAAATAARHGGGAGGEVQAFLAKLSDQQLSEIKQQYLATATPFHQQHYRGTDPRQHTQLAHELLNFSQRVPAQAPPPAAEASGTVA